MAKYCETTTTGALWITDSDGDRVLITRDDLREFFEQIDAARDEVFPPGPIEIPDPVRHEEVYANINANAKETFDPKELKGALGQLAAAAGNILQAHRSLS